VTQALPKSLRSGIAPINCLTASSWSVSSVASVRRPS
jgi:hypothetical protein